MVIWNDANVSLEGGDLGPLKTITLGWLVKNKQTGLTIATDWAEGFEAHGEARHFIPRPMIVDWWYLEIED